MAGNFPLWLTGGNVGGGKFSDYSSLGYSPSFDGMGFQYADGSLKSTTQLSGATQSSSAGSGGGTNWAAYAPLASMGIELGAGIGNAIGSYFTGKAQQGAYELQGQLEWQNAVSKASTLQFNAQQIQQTAGKQEYALYRQQKTRLESMKAETAANGVAMEGSAAHVIASQAAVDAKNREALIEESSNQQYSMLLGAQQSLQQGRNAVAYYNAMGKAARKNAKISGYVGLMQSTASVIKMGGQNYKDTGSFWGIG